MYYKRKILFITLICAIFFVNTYIVSFHNSPASNGNRYEPAESISLLLLGGIRGIVVDLLWARAIARFEEKKYYELLTVNNLIAKLQPNFPAVWIFQAWNMAYNIAHEWDSPQNKWKWIDSGLAFARKGAEKNVHSGDLFFELGYMHLHLFDQRYFKFAAYNRKQLLQTKGVDNFEASLYWLRKSLLNNPKRHNPLAIERTVCHALGNASLCAENEENIDEALRYAGLALDEWKGYHKRHPDDTAVDANEFINAFEKKKAYLQGVKEQHW